MIEKVKRTIEKYAMLEKGDRVVVGLSGGADSVTLLSVLYALKYEYNLTLCAVHINHGIRGDEAERDEKFVIDFCKKTGVELKVFRRDIPAVSKESGESEEECGRRIRYECFSDVAQGGKIATAHTLSDSTETMIFNMLRGSSAKGICGIPAKRENIIRPLIDCTREEIEKYCKVQKLSFVTDSTNLSSDYTRNYIRREILPMFSRVNPSYTAALSRLRSYISEDNDFLDKEAERLLNSALCGDSLSVCVLIKESPVLIRRALVSFIKNKSGITPESRHIELLCEKMQGDFTLQLSDNWFSDIRNGKISVIKKKIPAEKNDECIPLEIGENIFFESVICAQELNNKEFFNNYYNMFQNAVDCDKIKGGVFIRTRREGDRLLLQKRKVTKTLKKLFCEMKIPKEKRDSLPVLCDDEKILWVSGVGINGNCAVTKNTKKILLINQKR